MIKESQRIAEQIKKLVDQLASIANTESLDGKPSLKVKPKTKTGASGAISILIEEGFFNQPRDLSTVMSRMREIGHWHKKETVAMNLLNLTKRRTFNRIKDSKTKKWNYVIRR